MVVDSDSERRRDAVGGDVVMGRADSSGGENIRKPVAQGVDRCHDLILGIAHHPHLLQTDAKICQTLRKEDDIGVPGYVRKEFRCR